jgi:hypothetical protein
MPSQTFGKVTAVGPDDFLALVQQALAEAKQGLHLPKPYEDLLTRQYTIEEHTKAEFTTKNYYASAGALAEGIVVSNDELWVRADVVRNKPGRAKHIIRHEIAHAIAAVYLTAPKKQELLTIMENKNGQHPTAWKGGKYWNRPPECYADTLAVAVSGKDSPWDDFKAYSLDIRTADYWRLIDITFRMDPLPPEPDEPDPLPLPDPRIAELEAQVKSLEAQLAMALADLATANSKVEQLTADLAASKALLTELATDLDELAAQTMALANKARAGGTQP